MKPELQWKELLSDNHWLYIWTIPQTSNAEHNLTIKQHSHNKIPWVQLDLKPVRSNDVGLRLIFDEQHKLRMCLFDAPNIGRSVSLDQLSLPRQSKTNIILLGEFEFRSAAEFSNKCRRHQTTVKFAWIELMELRKKSEETVMLSHRECCICTTPVGW
ncbi:hypothetical protein AHF37_07685 [Paragonimus kellicotti]|nr:hypothetical protein AHF37_07685 [Paragonimus kellicotti]